MQRDELVSILGSIENLNSLEKGSLSPDVSIVPTDYTDCGSCDSTNVLVTSTDFFTPICQDPYIQGQIAASNTLSDLYAVGTSCITSMLMILCKSAQMDPICSEIVMRRIIQGFVDKCKEAGVPVTGGQTTINPWPIVGGVASAVVKSCNLVSANSIHAGDILILTKPLGTQVCANMAVWRSHSRLEDHVDKSRARKLAVARWNEYLHCGGSIEKCDKAVNIALKSMCLLNRNPARLISGNFREYVGGCTDITGFGLLGHSQNLLELQSSSLDFVFHTMPCVMGSVIYSNLDIGLRSGTAAETSGGLLIAVRPAHAHSLLNAIRQNCPYNWGWIVGTVNNGSHSCYIDKDVCFVEVD